MAVRRKRGGTLLSIGPAKPFRPVFLPEKWLRERSFQEIFPEECKIFSKLGFPVVIMGV